MDVHTQLFELRTVLAALPAYLAEVAARLLPAAHSERMPLRAFVADVITDTLAQMAQTVNAENAMAEVQQTWDVNKDSILLDLLSALPRIRSDETVHPLDIGSDADRLCLDREGFALMRYAVSTARWRRHLRFCARRMERLQRKLLWPSWCDNISGKVQIGQLGDLERFIAAPLADDIRKYAAGVARASRDSVRIANDAKVYKLFVLTLLESALSADRIASLEETRYRVSQLLPSSDDNWRTVSLPASMLYLAIDAKMTHKMASRFPCRAELLIHLHRNVLGSVVRGEIFTFYRASKAQAMCETAARATKLAQHMETLFTRGFTETSLPAFAVEYDTLEDTEQLLHTLQGKQRNDWKKLFVEAET